jgi:RNA polymerase sigma factor (sigma-70 family)
VTEEELVHLLSRGDRRAFEYLLARYHSVVYKTCRGIVHDEQEAEDVTQEVFIEVYKSISSFRSAARLITWIHRIAVNRSLDKVRKMQRTQGKQIISLDGENADHIANVPHLPNPSSQLEEKEKAMILKAAIDILPENQKAAFVLSRIEGLTQKEVAAILEIQEGALESLLQRARQNLKKSLSHYYYNR